MIFIISLTEEQKKAIRSRITWFRFRTIIEETAGNIANQWIEENKRNEE